MIRYALICADCDSEFEAWFASSSAYEKLAKANQLDCPGCRGHRVGKQIMAPAVRTSKKGGKAPAPSAAKLLEAAREHIATTYDYTGTDFPEEARAMYYGETEERPIWGETTPDEAVALREEGIAAQPLPAPLAPKLPKDKTKLN